MQRGGGGGRGGAILRRSSVPCQELSPWTILFSSLSWLLSLLPTWLPQASNILLFLGAAMLREMERMGQTALGAAEATQRRHSPVLLSALIHCIPQLSRFVSLPLLPSLEHEYTNRSMLKWHLSCTTTTYKATPWGWDAHRNWGALELPSLCPVRLAPSGCALPALAEHGQDLILLQPHHGLDQRCCYRRTCSWSVWAELSHPLLPCHLGMLEPIFLPLNISNKRLEENTLTPLCNSRAVEGILGHFHRPDAVLWGLRFQSLPELYKEEIACAVGLFFPLCNHECSPQTPAK